MALRTARWQNVTPKDPVRTARSIAQLSDCNLEDALRHAISDPGRFTPRRMYGPEDDREYESVSAWGARACVIVVSARLGLEDSK